MTGGSLWLSFEKGFTKKDAMDIMNLFVIIKRGISMKVIVSDLDGTILTKNKLEPINREKIQAFLINNKGNSFIIATGRGYMSFNRACIREKINFFDYSILANGALIIDRNNEVIASECLSKTIIKTIVEHSLKFLHTADLVYIDGVFREALLIENNTFFPEKIFNANILTFELQNPISENSEMLNAIETLNLPITIIRNGRYIDITPYGCDKAKAVKKIQNWDIYKNRAWFFIGDGANDISLAHLIDESFAILGGNKDLEKVAKYVEDTFEKCMEKIIMFSTPHHP